MHLLYTSVAACLLLASSIVAQDLERCGNRFAPPHLIQAHIRAAAKEHVDTKRLVRRSQLDIDLYVHIVERPNSTSPVTEAQVLRQVEIIQNIFAVYDINFDYQGYDRTINATWAIDSEPLAMKQHLRKGPYTALNVYIQDRIPDRDNPGQRLAGYATYPRGIELSDGSEPAVDEYFVGSLATYHALDGVCLVKTTIGNVPGPAGLGHTAAHEIGHWFGLFHTFEGLSCSGPGDLIADTRYERIATNGGCPIGKNTCDLPGVDPIHNFMDYSDDICTTEFTPLQVDRMFDLFEMLRVQDDVVSSSSIASSTLQASFASSGTSPAPITTSVAALTSTTLTRLASVDPTASPSLPASVSGQRITVTTTQNGTITSYIQIRIPTCPTSYVAPRTAPNYGSM